MTKLVAEQAALPFTELEKIRKIESELQLDMLLDEIPEIFEESQSGFERIATIINSMRNFSYRHAPDEKVLFDINGGIRDTIVLVEHEYLDSAKIETILEELPPVNCNPEQINQVFLNLIVNSAEAILEQHREAKGNITIRTWFNQDEVGCSIADDGSGIAEELRSKIFDPFFTTKSPGKGTGLGLSISYDTIVRKHGGTLSVACPAEGGTIFTMTLPR